MPIAVMSRSRLALLPKVPTIQELGITKNELEVWYVIFSNKSKRKELQKIQSILTGLVKDKSNHLIWEQLGIEEPEDPVPPASFIAREKIKYQQILSKLDIKF